MSGAKINVGDGINADNASWTFGGQVANSFTDHVRKSVPLYDAGHDLTCALSDYFVRENSTCYELGSSTGVLSRKLSIRHQSKGARFIGIDVVPEMVDRAQAESGESLSNLSFISDDINTYAYEPADLVVAYYTVQFVSPHQRQRLIDRIYQSLNWGGALIMFEKVRAPDARFQDYMSALYTDYKLEQGYNPEEIVAKARSLKRVLEPFSTQGNYDLLKRAGFIDCMTVLKYVCFEGFLAIK